MKLFNERRNFLYKLIFLAFITVIISAIFCCCAENSVSSQIVIESTSQESEIIAESESFNESQTSNESDVEIESNPESESDVESVLEESQEESQIEIYSVIFLIDGVEFLSESVLGGNLLSEPTDPIKYGFAFLGWYNGEELFDFSVPISENLVLVAKWQENVYYTVTFVSNSDSVILPQSIEENSFAIKPDDPQKDGFEFLGWHLNGEIYDFSSPVCQNLELVAMWKEIIPPTVTITFDANGGSQIESVIIDRNSCVAKPQEPVKDGFVFVGWYLNGELFDFATPIEEDIEFVARWEQLKSIEELAGTWRGYVSSNPEEERVLQIFSSGIGILQVNRFGISYNITYDVNEVVYYANIVVICYESGGILRNLYFEFNGEYLVCKDILLDEELILTKE